MEIAIGALVFVVVGFLSYILINSGVRLRRAIYYQSNFGSNPEKITKNMAKAYQKVSAICDLQEARNIWLGLLYFDGLLIIVGVYLIFFVHVVE